MKASVIVSALSSILALNVQGVSAKCYTSGDKWLDRDQAAKFAWDACYKDNGMFAGYFRPGQVKSMCPRVGGLGYLFEVENGWDQTLDLANDDCYVRLKNEIYACERGGESTTSKWRFRADPGNC